MEASPLPPVYTTVFHSGVPVWRTRSPPPPPPPPRASPTRPPTPPPPPSYSSVTAASSSPQGGGAATSSAAPREWLLQIEEQMVALRHDIMSRFPLTPPSPSPSFLPPPSYHELASLPVPLAPPIHTTGTAAVTCAANDSSSVLVTTLDGAKVHELGKQLLEQQESILNMLREAMQHFVGTTSEKKASDEIDRGENTLTRSLCANANIMEGEEASSEEESRVPEKLDLVDLLTSFYNLPESPSCLQCSASSPTHSVSGETLLATALGTTNRELRDRYTTLLLRRWNKCFAKGNEVVSTKRIGDSSCSPKAEALVALPLPVLHRVLNVAQIPDERIAYRMARAACERHHWRHTSGVSASQRILSFVPTASCRCSESEARTILDAVRFLWLPLRFLEDEQLHCESPGVAVGHCAIWSGLLLRLGQAIRAKKCLMDRQGSATSAAAAAEPLLVELSRVRQAYSFLTEEERSCVACSEGLDMAQLLRMQERCDSITPSHVTPIS